MQEALTYQEIENKSTRGSIQNILTGYTVVKRKRVKLLLKDRHLKVLNEYYKHLKTKLNSEMSIEQNLRLASLFIIGIKCKNLKEIRKNDIDSYYERCRVLKRKSANNRMIGAMQFIGWLTGKKKNENELIKHITIKKDKNGKLPEDIYLTDEILKLISVADNFRDKAIICLLYETAARIGEFLQLKVKHVTFYEKYASIYLPQGKTTSRVMPVIYSLPHLKNWLNTHPQRDNPEAPLFINTKAWIGMPFGFSGVYRILRICRTRAGIKKKIHPHLLRHSRLTELAKKLTEQELKVFAGWVGDSGMARVYVHLSGQDVGNKILAAAGIIDKQSEQLNDILLNTECPRCKTLNPATSKYCEYCSMVLDLKEVMKLQEDDEKKRDILKKQLEEMKNQMEVWKNNIRKELLEDALQAVRREITQK